MEKAVFITEIKIMSGQAAFYFHGVITISIMQEETFVLGFVK